ncbi:MAG TPA: hypothetical protein VKZ71_06835 [Burkholderiaceae bacterium]|nr:hypothetical protein [Burkholderiaceae bacterium]
MKKTPDRNTGKLEKDPRAELGLTPPPTVSGEQSEDTPADKATRFDGNPNPQGAQSETLKPKDDTPMRLKKTEGVSDEQKTAQHRKATPDHKK